VRFAGERDGGMVYACQDQRRRRSTARMKGPSAVAIGPSRHQLVVVALGVIAAVLIAEVGGIVFGWDRIGPNVVEGLAAIVLTSTAVGAIVDFLRRRSEGARWELVRRRTLRTLQHHLVHSVQILVRDDATAGGAPPVFSRWERLEINETSLPGIVAAMRQEVEEFDRARAMQADISLQDALRGVVYHLNRAVERSMLRVMTLADEELVALIAELDDETEMLRSLSASRPEAEQRAQAAGYANPSFIFGADNATTYLLDYLAAVGGVARYVCDHMPEGDWIPEWSQRVARFDEPTS
jgi:hypothetical protein